MSKEERSQITLCSHRILTCNQSPLDLHVDSMGQVTPEHSNLRLGNEDGGTIYRCAWTIELITS